MVMMKTYDIELQRLKAVKHGNDMFELAIDALVQLTCPPKCVPAEG
jgi:hypothetical protein